MELEGIDLGVEGFPQGPSAEDVSYYSNDFCWEEHAAAMRSQVSTIPVRGRSSTSSRRDNSNSSITI